MKKQPALSISNWSIEKLIIYYYPRIKEITNLRAFKMRLDAEDLLSQVNYLLSAAAIKKSFTGNRESEFIAWVNRLILNAGLNMLETRRRESAFLLEVDPEQVDIDQISKLKSYQTCTSQTHFLKRVIEHVNQKYSKRSTFYIDVFKRVLIDGEEYHEAAEAMQININNVKTAVFQVRKTVIEKFGREYTELINN